MLYKEPVIPLEKKEDFLFSNKPYNEDIDINQVAAIQDFYEKNCYIKEEDIPTLVKRALHEGNPLYPVPKIMDAKDCEALIRKIMR